MRIFIFLGLLTAFSGLNSAETFIPEQFLDAYHTLSEELSPQCYQQSIRALLKLDEEKKLLLDDIQPEKPQRIPCVFDKKSINRYVDDWYNTHPDQEMTQQTRADLRLKAAREELLHVNETTVQIRQLHRPQQKKMVEQKPRRMTRVCQYARTMLDRSCLWLDDHILDQKMLQRIVEDSSFFKKNLYLMAPLSMRK